MGSDDHREASSPPPLGAVAVPPGHLPGLPLGPVLLPGTQAPQLQGTQLGGLGGGGGRGEGGEEGGGGSEENVRADH